MSDITMPGKRMLFKIAQRYNFRKEKHDLCKLILTYDPSYTETLAWTDDEKKAFALAHSSERASDKLFALFIIARKLEGNKDFEMPKIFLPEGVQI